MAGDLPRTPILADVRTGLHDFWPAVRRIWRSIRLATGRDARQRREATLRWIRGRGRSEDPVVARQVLIRAAQLDRWPPRRSRGYQIAMWICLVFFASVFARNLVLGAEPRKVVVSGVFVLVGLFNLFVGPRMMAGRNLRLDKAVAEARQALAAHMGS